MTSSALSIEDALAQTVEQLSYSMDAHERRAVEKSRLASLSSTQIHYLDMIRHMGDPPVGELAERMGVARPTATMAVNDLTTAGYLRKSRNPGDRRSVLVSLTRRGQAVAELHDEIHAGYANLISSALGEQDTAQLESLLRRALRTIDASKEAGGE